MSNFTGWICLCLLPLLALPRVHGLDAAQDAFSKATCDFSIELLKVQSKLSNSKNVILSPFSVENLLSILQQGAKENTLAQLESVIHMTAEQSKLGQVHILKSLQREKRNVSLEWGNRAYVAPGFEISDAFNTTIRENFQAIIQELNFAETSPVELAQVINNWIKEATHDNIKDIIQPSTLTPDLVLILLNAVYYKGLWDVPFPVYLTQEKSFKPNPNESVRVPFMSQEERFIAGVDEESGVKWLDLPFKDEQFSMLFMLPTEEHGLSALLERMNGSLLRGIVDDYDTKRVTVTLPKFKLQERISLAQPLRELGVTDIFDQKANFQGISPNENIRVSRIMHEAGVEVDELGSTAFAVTLDQFQLTSGYRGNDTMIFHADHPFFFFILDRENKIPLFSGIVGDPS